jgi:predicted PhzF superfamily epimerase YddE/YHI9
MRLKMYRVDAFTGEIFHGNPAGVIPLRRWLDDATLQNIAMENNLSETAFFVPDGAAYKLRWFTPAAEVPLCGHATLASGFVLLQLLGTGKRSVRFHTQSGDLTVTGSGGLLRMDFPRYVPRRCEPPAAVTEGLGIRPQEFYDTAEDRHYYAVLSRADDVRLLAPRMDPLAQSGYGVAVTAPGEDADFVSRFFAPNVGIPEDPVTGSMHCALIPYWAGRLGKTQLHARQFSRRGGELFCEDLPGEGRVRIAGRAVLSLTGYIDL